MWDGHLGCISKAKRGIKLFSDYTKPIHAAPYRAGPKTQEFEKTEIEQMLKNKIIGPAQTEWAGPIVSTTKKDVSLRFCVH